MTEPRWRRYLRFFRRDAVADVDDELRFHFDERVEQYRASGMSNDEAVAAAHAQFGDIDAVRTDLVTINRRSSHMHDARDRFDALPLPAARAARVDPTIALRAE